MSRTTVDLSYRGDAEPLSTRASIALRSYVLMTGESGRTRVSILHTSDGVQDAVQNFNKADTLFAMVPSLAQWIRLGGDFFIGLAEGAMVDVNPGDQTPVPERGELIERLEVGDPNVYTGIVGMTWEKQHLPRQFIARPTDIGAWEVEDVTPGRTDVLGVTFDAEWSELVRAAESVRCR